MQKATPIQKQVPWQDQPPWFPPWMTSTTIQQPMRFTETETRRGRMAAEPWVPAPDALLKMAGIKPPEEDLTLTRVKADPYNILKPRKKKVEKEELEGFAVDILMGGKKKRRRR